MCVCVDGGERGNYRLRVGGSNLLAVCDPGKVRGSFAVRSAIGGGAIGCD